MGIQNPNGSVTMSVHSIKTVSGYAFFLTAERMRMSKLITYENQTIEISDRLFEFMEQDKKRQVAEERSDRRYLSKSSFETVKIKQECSSKEFENLVFHNLSLKKMRTAVNELSDDEQKLIEMYYWNNQSMQEIGKVFAVSKMAVSKRHKKILDKLRASVI